MPTIIKGSIAILSDAGLGMAMFSLGTFLNLLTRHKEFTTFWILWLIYWEKKILSSNFFQMTNLVNVWLIRFVYGFTTKDHCLWKIRGSIFNGCQVLNWSSSNCSNLNRYWSSWGAFACCNCSGIPSNFWKYFLIKK